MRPYLLFIAMLLGAIIVTAAIGSAMDARVVVQEQQREQAHHSVYAGGPALAP